MGSPFKQLAAIWNRLGLNQKVTMLVLSLGVLVGLAVKHLEAVPVPAGTILIHGEMDTTVPLADVLAWARPQDLPVVVVPGADHFFHRRLAILRAIVQNSWQ